MKLNDCETQPFEPGLLIERSALNHQRSRSVDNWPFTFSIIDGEVVKNVYRFDRKAFIAAQEDALF